MTTILHRRHFLAGSAGLLLSAHLAGRARARTQNSLTFALSAYPPSIKPFEHAGTAAVTVKIQLFRGLLGYGPNGEFTPELAESWTMDAPNAVTLKLRPNANFHNGEPVTSEDVRYSIEAIRAEKSTAYLRNELRIIETIETPDAKTVRLVLKEPSATLLYYLASPYAPIISAKAAAANPNNAVGAGPFMITEMEKGTKIEFKRFADFYKPGLPKVETMRFIVYGDENLRVAALQAGDVDLIEYVPWQSMDSIAANPKLKLDTVDGPYMYLQFNTKAGPFTDARVRRAVAHAVKRDDIVKVAFFGRGSILEALPIPKASPFFDAELGRSWPYDPERAKKLLAEAGKASGFATTLLSSATYNMHKDTAEIVQQNLAPFGIQVQLNLPEWGARVALGNKGQYEFAVNGSALDFNDPDALTGVIGGGSPSYHRPFGFESQAIDALLAKGRHELDEGKRRAIYNELQKVAAEEVPVAGLAWRSQGFAMHDYVQGFRNLPGALTFFSGFMLEATGIA